MFSFCYKRCLTSSKNLRKAETTKTDPAITYLGPAQSLNKQLVYDFRTSLEFTGSEDQTYAKSSPEQKRLEPKQHLGARKLSGTKTSSMLRRQSRTTYNLGRCKKPRCQLLGTLSTAIEMVSWKDTSQKQTAYPDQEPKRAKEKNDFEMTEKAIEICFRGRQGIAEVKLIYFIGEN